MMNGMSETPSGAWRIDQDAAANENLARFSVGGLILFCWVLFALAMLSGCLTQSVHPIYSDETLVFDEKLIGSFEDSDGVWTFTQAGSRSYDAEHVDKRGVRASFEVHLAEINDTVFLDLYPDEWPDEGSEVLEAMVQPVHWFLKVEEIGDRLVVAELDNEWLAEYLADFPNLIRHTVVSDRILLTDNTERLQAFVSAQVNNVDAWGEGDALPRIPETRR